MITNTKLRKELITLFEEHSQMICDDRAIGASMFGVMADRVINLVSGKQRPLAKNKQTHIICPKCSSDNINDYNDGLSKTCNDCQCAFIG